MTALVLGVVGFNAVLLATGYGVLAASLERRPARSWPTYAGVALLVGAAVVGVGVVLATIAGFTAGVPTLGAVVALAVALGLVHRAFAPGRWRRRVAAPDPPLRAPSSRMERAVTIVAGFGVAAIAGLALVGGFRSSPWLDDVWGIWLPKGVALGSLGLDPRLFAESGRFVSFEVADYPLWWPVVLELDMRFVGDIDLRAANAQLTILALAFVAAAARLLAGWVRPWLIACALLLLTASPEFLRHMQGGIADLPLAIYLALTALCLAGWVTSRDAFYLPLAAISGAAALAIKAEGLPLLLVVVAVSLLVALVHARPALPGLLLASSAALATALPWIAWRRAHGVESQVALADAVSPAYLADRAERVGPSAETLLRHLFDPTEWLLVVPLLLALAVTAARARPRVVWLAPTLLLVAGYAFWVWAYWAESEDLGYLLSTSAYRAVDSLVLSAWIFVPLLGEAVLRRRTASGSRIRSSFR